MNNKEKIKNMLADELAKCNNFNYNINFGKLNLKVNTKKINQKLIDSSIYFEGGVGSEWRFDHKKKSYFWLSKEHIWSKFEKETELEYSYIQQLVKSVLEEGFKLKGITPLISNVAVTSLLEEGFKLKGITPNSEPTHLHYQLEEGFKLKGTTLYY